MESAGRMVYTKLKQTVTSFLNYSESKKDESGCPGAAITPAELQTRKLVERVSGDTQRWAEAAEARTAADTWEGEAANTSIVAAVEKHFN